MGMYDEIIVRKPLPGGPEDQDALTRFQTKSFDCALDTYTITENGTLLRTETSIRTPDTSSSTTQPITSCSGTGYRSRLSSARKG